MAGSKQIGSQLPKRVGVREFRSNMSEVLKQARLGTTFLITAHDQVVAELHPPSASVRSPREPGALKGKISMAPDFDDLPPDLLAAIETGGA